MDNLDYAARFEIIVNFNLILGFRLSYFDLQYFGGDIHVLNSIVNSNTNWDIGSKY